MLIRQVLLFHAIRKQKVWVLTLKKELAIKLHFISIVLELSFIEKYRLANVVNTTLGYSEKCHVYFNRPIAGYANLCPNMISTQPQEFIGMLSTVKHEIIHALVNAINFYPCLQTVDLLFILSS